jgi:rhomboid family GlyGly-CTERM serine protease
LPRRRESQFLYRLLSKTWIPAFAGMTWTTSLLLILACLALAAPGSLTAHLAYDREAIFNGELWRLWTAHLVHFSFQHAASDALVLLAATTLAQGLASPRMVCCTLAIGAPAISLGLLLAVPEMTEYRGASGLAVMMSVLCAGLLWPAASHRIRLLLAVAGCALSAKLVADAMGIAINLAGLPTGVAVAWQAHAFGACCAVAAILWHRRHTASNPPICAGRAPAFK